MNIWNILKINISFLLQITFIKFFFIKLFLTIKSSVSKDKFMNNILK